MGWYGGQDGARRLRSRNAVADSFARFEASLGSSDNVEMKDFTNNLHDNRNYDVIKNILVDPTPQDSLIEQINASTKDKVAIAIAFSHSLQTFDDISDQICQRLQGLYLFGTVNVKKEDLLRFIRRCPSLKSLMLACVDDFAEPFLKTLFDETLLPKLEFLEVSNANNDAIAAMHTAPNLRKIVFRWPDPGISDAGFERLVANGGAKNLVAISVRFTGIGIFTSTTILPVYPLPTFRNIFFTGRCSPEGLVQESFQKLSQVNTSQVCCGRSSRA